MTTPTRNDDRPARDRYATLSPAVFRLIEARQALARAQEYLLGAMGITQGEPPRNAEAVARELLAAQQNAEMAARCLRELQDADPAARILGAVGA